MLTRFRTTVFKLNSVLEHDRSTKLAVLNTLLLQTQRTVLVYFEVCYGTRLQVSHIIFLDPQMLKPAISK